MFWVDFGTPRGSEPGYRRPCVILQNNVLNSSHLATVVVCPLTSNLARSVSISNVTLRKGEANLPRRSVVNTSAITTVDRQQLEEKIGTLSHKRVDEIIAGLAMIFQRRLIA